MRPLCPPRGAAARANGISDAATRRDADGSFKRLMLRTKLRPERAAPRKYLAILVSSPNRKQQPGGPIAVEVLWICRAAARQIVSVAIADCRNLPDHPAAWLVTTSPQKAPSP